jgi:hypothetical protein
MLSLAQTSFWGESITLVGFVATLLSLYYAIRQVRDAKSAAEAARSAAQEALVKSQQNYLRYVAANSHRYVNEVIIHVDHQAWQLATLRLSDLADQISQLASDDAEWKTFSDALRTWATTTKRLHTEDLKRFARSKWEEFLLRLQAKIDSYYGPFRSTQKEDSDATG